MNIYPIAKKKYNNWTTTLYFNTNTNKPGIMIDDGFNSDYIMVYEDGTHARDFFNSVPVRVSVHVGYFISLMKTI